MGNLRRSPLGNIKRSLTTRRQDTNGHAPLTVYAGISKAGNRWVWALVINTAWAWLRFQPTSALTALVPDEIRRRQ